MFHQRHCPLKHVVFCSDLRQDCVIGNVPAYVIAAGPSPFIVSPQISILYVVYRLRPSITVDRVSLETITTFGSPLRFVPSANLTGVTRT